eukprot:CAMPEP_0177632602 /NCGR_PEP_ID=MMETSP0447-20121125/2390_1 /TAXON_ID=0 /ORGANISM="Stygamoeba regulata, Strain BSH-02190019" /LENGTH=86 /DNA_ID=CAMNT_0019134203 /DNA_START=53 /DNA_END=313 /DNA_ORIENTATION=-
MAWSCKKDNTNYYCLISGGYVLFGYTTGIEPSANTTFVASVDEFMAGSYKEELRQNIGEEALKGAIEKCNQIIAIRSQKTSAPRPA